MSKLSLFITLTLSFLSSCLLGGFLAGRTLRRSEAVYAASRRRLAARRAQANAAGGDKGATAATGDKSEVDSLWKVHPTERAIGETLGNTVDVERNDSIFSAASGMQILNTEDQKVGKGCVIFVANPVLKASFHQHEDTESLINSMAAEMHVSANFDIKATSISGSLEGKYTSREESSTNKQTVHFDMQVNVRRYALNMECLKWGSLDKSITKSFSDLPSKCDTKGEKDDYWRFAKNNGSHVITQLSTGSKLQAIMTLESESKLTSTQIDAKLCADAKTGSGAGGGLCGPFDYGPINDTFSASYSQDIKAVGGRPNAPTLLALTGIDMRDTIDLREKASAFIVKAEDNYGVRTTYRNVATVLRFLKSEFFAENQKIFNKKTECLQMMFWDSKLKNDLLGVDKYFSANATDAFTHFQYPDEAQIYEQAKLAQI